MAKVRCVTMQRNEHALLGAWVRHHGYLFGMENLYIYDNGSDDASVVSELAEIERLGVNVLRDYVSKSDFDHKGDIVANLIRGWDSSGEDYDFAMTIDTDEFIFLRGKTLSVSRKVINEYFDSLKGVDATFILDKMFLNMPHSNELYAAFTVPKAIFARGTLKDLDHGYHRPVTHAGHPDLSVDLGYFHLHHKSFADVIRSARAKLEPYVDVSDIRKIREHTGAGHHLIKFFNMTEYDYRGMYDNDILYFAPQLYWQLKFLGADTASIFNCTQKPTFEGVARRLREESLPTEGLIFRAPVPEGPPDQKLYAVFDPDFYLRTQSDIAQGKVDPLTHFAQYGYREGRPFGENAGSLVIARQAEQPVSNPRNSQKYAGAGEQSPQKMAGKQ